VNTKKPMLHNEGTESQVYASYNPEILRTDSYAIAVDGTIRFGFNPQKLHYFDRASGMSLQA